MDGALWAFPQKQAASSIRRQIARDETMRARARGTDPAPPRPAPAPGVRHRTCQWPMWGDADPVPSPPLFCAAPVVEGRPYCPCHAARATAVSGRSR